MKFFNVILYQTMSFLFSCINAHLMDKKLAFFKYFLFIRNHHSLFTFGTILVDEKGLTFLILFVTHLSYLSFWALEGFGEKGTRDLAKNFAAENLPQKKSFYFKKKFLVKIWGTELDKKMRINFTLKAHLKFSEWCNNYFWLIHFKIFHLKHI